MKVNQAPKQGLRIWVIRPGKRGSFKKCSDQEQLFLANGVAGLRDEHGIGDLCHGNRSKEFIVKMVSVAHPNMHHKAVASVVGNVFRFAKDVQNSDLVICPSRVAKIYYLGIMKSEYYFDSQEKFQHYRKVEWIGEIAKENVSIEAQREIGAARLFFECKRNADEIELIAIQMKEKEETK
jgi:predicted Mrr-cat superfamily restriction endonuclease